MITQKTPNAWSCLPTAFAITLNMDVEDVITAIGDDGSNEVLNGLQEPFNRQGFHPQQLIRMCLEIGISVTHIDMHPCASPDTPRSHSEPLGDRYYDTGGWDWFSENLFNSEGVVACRKGSGVGHAVAYQGMGTYAKICDPATETVFEMGALTDAEKRDLFMFALWRVDG